MNRELEGNVHMQVDFGMIIGSLGESLNTVKDTKDILPKDSKLLLLLDAQEKMIEFSILRFKKSLMNSDYSDIQNLLALTNCINNLATVINQSL